MNSFVDLYIWLFEFYLNIFVLREINKIILSLFSE